jgi:16S rRNA (adenine1518-N6/adenine1519-N6)-dimethyltransferase
MATEGRRRAFGQHFLRDQSIAKQIAEAAVNASEKYHCETLLEIGPGRGAITEPILELASKSEKIRRVVLCEKDRAIAHDWTHQTSYPKYGDGGLLEVEDSDFLLLDENKWLAHAPLVVASNLPYSVGTAIFTRLAQHPGKIRAMVLMFQAEVTQRLRAEIGTKSWGSLSIWTQNQWDVTKLLTVPPRAFQPPPEVMSEVALFLPRAEPRVSIPEGFDRKKALAVWESLLKTSFLHRRKMLRSGLPKSGPIRNAFELSGLDGTKRAEALDWQEWEKLFHALLRSQ